MDLDADDSYSHVGLIHRADQNIFVIHTTWGEPPIEWKYVRIEPLDTFLAQDRASEAAVYRVGTPDPVRSAAVQKALEYLQSRIPFDTEFDITTSDRMYCTELVWRAYSEAGLDLIDGKFEQRVLPMLKGPFIFPSSLLKSRFLRPVWIAGGKAVSSQ
jgi:uncharacterized protein YycO